MPDGWRSWQNGAYAANESRAGDSQTQPQPSTPFGPTDESRPLRDAEISFSSVRTGLSGVLRLLMLQCLSCLHLVTLNDERGGAWDGNPGKMIEVRWDLCVWGAGRISLCDTRASVRGSFVVSSEQSQGCRYIVPPCQERREYHSKFFLREGVRVMLGRCLRACALERWCVSMYVCVFGTCMHAFLYV